jgi:hypothetical protein
MLGMLAALVSSWTPTLTPSGGAAQPRQLLRASSPEMMPIGVPKASACPPAFHWMRAGCVSDAHLFILAFGQVAYRVPGATSADWVDIYNRLYRERIIFLGQEIDDEICNQIIAVMLFSDSEDGQKPMYMYVNSPGGSVIAGLALYDTIQHISSPVITCNIGMAASMVRRRPPYATQLADGATHTQRQLSDVGGPGALRGGVGGRARARRPPSFSAPASAASASPCRIRA